eukprot:1194224-Prorocentrum_minimum.AAC.1
MSDEKRLVLTLPLYPNQLHNTSLVVANKKAKFRPLHTRGENSYDWQLQKDVVADTAKEAKAILRRTTGFHWVRKSPQNKPKGEILRCASHPDCRALAKVGINADNKWLLFTLPTLHNSGETISKQHGIDSKFIDKVEHDGQPTFVANQLVLGPEYEYPSLEEGHDAKSLPSAEQCKNRFNKVLRNQGARLALPDLKTKADADLYAVEHMCPTSKEEIPALPSCLRSLSSLLHTLEYTRQPYEPSNQLGESANSGAANSGSANSGADSGTGEDAVDAAVRGLLANGSRDSPAEGVDLPAKGVDSPAEGVNSPAVRGLLANGSDDAQRRESVEEREGDEFTSEGGGFTSGRGAVGGGGGGGGAVAGGGAAARGGMRSLARAA